MTERAPQRGGKKRARAEENGSKKTNKQKTPKQGKKTSNEEKQGQTSASRNKPTKRAIKETECQQRRETTHACVWSFPLCFLSLAQQKRKAKQATLLENKKKQNVERKGFMTRN